MRSAADIFQEAKSKFSEAQELYERIIEEHPSDHVSCFLRCVCGC